MRLRSPTSSALLEGAGFTLAIRRNGAAHKHLMKPHMATAHVAAWLRVVPQVQGRVKRGGRRARLAGSADGLKEKITPRFHARLSSRKFASRATFRASQKERDELGSDRRPRDGPSSPTCTAVRALAMATKQSVGHVVIVAEFRAVSCCPMGFFLQSRALGGASPRGLGRGCECPACSSRRIVVDIAKVCPQAIGWGFQSEALPPTTS